MFYSNFIYFIFKILKTAPLESVRKMRFPVAR